MVVLRDEDLDHLPLATRKTVEILGFVNVGDIDPLLYDRPYYAAPDGSAAQRPYALLVEALARTAASASRSSAPPRYCPRSAARTHPLCDGGLPILSVPVGSLLVAPLIGGCGEALMNHQEAWLRRAVCERLSVVEGLAPDDPGYAAAYGELEQATTALLDFAGRLPQLRREELQQRRRRWLRVLGAAQVGVALPGAVFAVAGPTSWGWLLLLVPAVAAGVWQLFETSSVGPQKLAGAGLGAVGGLFATLMAFHTVSGFWTFGVLALWAARLVVGEAGAK
jgi:hypothetical protein